MLNVRFMLKITSSIQKNYFVFTIIASYIYIYINCIVYKCHKSHHLI